MTDDRHLQWEGCANVRDLGGLRTRDGRAIRHGAIVRGDALDRLSAAGWAALEAHGVRTVIDLRNHDELAEDLAPRPAGRPDAASAARRGGRHGVLEGLARPPRVRPRSCCWRWPESASTKSPRTTA